MPRPGSKTSSSTAESRTDMSIDAAWSTLLRLTFPGMCSATFSQALQAGRSPRELRAGRKIESCGPAPRRASRSRSQDSSAAPMMIGTCGPTYFASPVPDGPLSSWESRLRQRLARTGSTESLLTWKASATPAGRSLSRLVPSTRPTEGTVCGLWPTMRAGDGACAAIKWPPRANPKGRIEDFVALALWPAPTSLAPAKNGNNEAGNSAGLVAIRAHALAAAEVNLTAAETQGHASPAGSAGTTAHACCLAPSSAMWPTPCTPNGGRSPAKGMSNTGKTPDGKKRQVDIQWIARGLEPDGSSATTEKPGALNPQFVCWLMGFPPEWDACAPTAMPSSRKSRPK